MNSTRCGTGLTTVLILLSVLLWTAGFVSAGEMPEKEEIKILILPKFEIGEMTGDFPGEAQYYYDEYVKGGGEYTIRGGYDDHLFYVKNGVGLYVTGMGKVNSALSVSALLNDERFDFSDAYFLSTGCAGGAFGRSVLGDVYVVTAAADFDLGHHADPRDMKESEKMNTWFRDESFDPIACRILNQELADTIYELVKDVPLENTDLSREYMTESFDHAGWADREPAVFKGTGVTADNYWKGIYDHKNAVFITESYGCPDPYAVTEMEDIAIATALDRMGMLDRYMILRDVVDIDVFYGKMTPETLWDPGNEESISSDSSEESADIFPVAMKNNFEVGRVIVDAVLEEGLEKSMADEAA